MPIHYFCCINTFLSQILSHIIFYITDKKNDKGIAITYYHNFEKEPIGSMATRKKIITLLQNSSRQFHKGITTATVNQPKPSKDEVGWHHQLSTWHQEEQQV